MLRIAVFVVSCCALAGAAPSADFEPYRGARKLCAEHVTGNSMHITWSTHATSDDLNKVVAFYEQTLGRKAGTGARGERTFEAKPDRSLSIYPAARHADFPHCETKPKAAEKTVILVSRAIR